LEPKEKSKDISKRIDELEKKLDDAQRILWFVLSRVDKILKDKTKKPIYSLDFHWELREYPDFPN
jgi:hypothetical protein